MAAPNGNFFYVQPVRPPRRYGEQIRDIQRRDLHTCGRRPIPDFDDEAVVWRLINEQISTYTGRPSNLMPQLREEAPQTEVEEAPAQERVEKWTREVSLSDLVEEVANSEPEPAQETPKPKKNERVWGDNIHRRILSPYDPTISDFDDPQIVQSRIELQIAEGKVREEQDRERVRNIQQR